MMSAHLGGEASREQGGLGPAGTLRSAPATGWIPPALLVFLLPMALVAQTPPCDTPDHRAFDFWVGTWEVFTPDGNRAGTNSIRLVMGGCALHESYDGARGYHGESLNVFDGSRGVWHQTWVDNGGLLLVLEGGLQAGAMVLEGVTLDAQGNDVLNRIIWTPLDSGGHRVRQHWERSTDGGRSWTTTFDGEYRRRDPDGGVSLRPNGVI